MFEINNNQEGSSFEKEFNLKRSIDDRDSFCCEYADRVKKEIEESAKQDKCFDFFMKSAPKDLSGKKIIDIGCGEGRWSRFFSQRGSVVLGIDKKDQILEVAREKSKNFKNINFVNLPFEKIEEEPIGRFDYIINSYVLHNFNNLDQFFSTANHLLKMNGKLLLISILFHFSDKKLEDSIKNFYIPIKNQHGEIFYAMANDFSNLKKLAENYKFKLNDFCSNKNTGLSLSQKLIDAGLSVENVALIFEKKEDSV
ncbi:MAG: hypothetical protein CO140_01235 [Candidatus Moranbacteria bacterium CG_4_9_14_3_um_filter_40_7]|uniref:Methyltransferase domain-containing protein n=1 Tax=Candidatus Nealsonbacteria bacterium CG23_combo_of_CG06-09_8_20_14_all_37_18 TaxID=1974720 RepID=A0A2G9YZ06_9BACT|nr:MAG: hypothetical protein COX35_00285 [Candidatus Nealsonbacteria bacterium CG23_combo_of_CG06-09_8_20_14_all_37_18]PJA88004.1 MAG: hypothetical protein CO140_01235 [Candidatus Moranbacteria bacterium CG_4_9_14_3_um_filter_40_7]